MDVPKVVSELHTELEQIEHEIQSLERTDTGTNEATAPSVSETGREPDSRLQ
jgi:hypothetical protein